MIGIQQLDDLTSEEMVGIINGNIRIKVKDPDKVQTSISNVLEPQSVDDLFLDDGKVITLLNMELESRAGWEWLGQKIKEQQIKDASS